MSSENFTGWRKATHSNGNGACVEVATGWRKSTYSAGNAECVEVAAHQQMVGVRDTKQHGAGQVVEFTTTAWRTFIANAKRANA